MRRGSVKETRNAVREHGTSAHAEEEREIREAALDQTIEASFPASDPPSSDPIRTIMQRSTALSTDWVPSAATPRM